MVISLGGSMIVPNEINASFLKKFYKLIIGELKNYDKIFIVTGGGATARNYQKAAGKVVDLAAEDLDWLGVHSTRLNGHLLRAVFRKHAHPRMITKPDRKEKISPGKKIVIGAGWKPGWSTDYVAVMLAKTYGLDVVVNLSNISYVYDKDPRTHKNAKKMEHMTWKQYRGIIPKKWSPGLNLPFDPVASKLAQDIDMEVAVLNGSDLKNIKRFLDGKSFEGTTIGADPY